MENFSTWMRGAERRLETLPGVLSASLEGDLDRATEVRPRVEEDPPVSEILHAVRVALEGNADEYPLGAFFRIQVGSVGDESPYIQDEIHEDPAVASRDTPESGGIRLITHQVRDVSPGVMGVELTLGLLGRRFAGGRVGASQLSRKRSRTGLGHPECSGILHSIRVGRSGRADPRARERIPIFTRWLSSGGGGRKDVWACGAADRFLAVDRRVRPGGCPCDTRGCGSQGHPIINRGRSTAPGVNRAT